MRSKVHSHGSWWGSSNSCLYLGKPILVITFIVKALVQTDEVQFATVLVWRRLLWHLCVVGYLIGNVPWVVTELALSSTSKQVAVVVTLKSVKHKFIYPPKITRLTKMNMEATISLKIQENIFLCLISSAAFMDKTTLKCAVSEPW